MNLYQAIDRLSRNLKDFDMSNVLFEDYLKSVKSQINDNTILIIDGSDITKNYTTKMEGIAQKSGINRCHLFIPRFQTGVVRLELTARGFGVQ